MAPRDKKIFTDWVEERSLHMQWARAPRREVCKKELGQNTGLLRLLRAWGWAPGSMPQRSILDIARDADQEVPFYKQILAVF